MDCVPHIHVAAIHADAGAGYNNDTKGIGVLCALGEKAGEEVNKSRQPLDGLADGLSGRLSMLVGQLKNSEGARSSYAALSYHAWSMGPVSVGWFGGVVTGYQAIPLAPLGGVVASIPLSPHAQAHLALSPSPITWGSTSMELSVSFDF